MNHLTKIKKKRKSQIDLTTILLQINLIGITTSWECCEGPWRIATTLRIQISNYL